MKNLIKIVTIAIVVSFLSSTFITAQEHNHKHKGDKNKSEQMMMKMEKMKKIDKNKDGIVYECPMKCEAPKDAPGECPKCGMKLQKISIKDMNKKMMDKGKMMKNKKMMDHNKMQNSKNMMGKDIKIKGMEKMGDQTKKN